MNDIGEYMEVIVEPTFADLEKNPHSARHAYLACLVIYHVVDRSSQSGDPTGLAEKWISESLAFSLVAEVAQSLKHGTRRWVKKMKKETPGRLLVTSALGLDGDLKNLEVHNLYYQIRAAIAFVREKAIAHVAK